mgnify:CR=1 FL=1
MFFWQKYFITVIFLIQPNIEKIVVIKHIGPNLAKATFSQNQKSHQARTLCNGMAMRDESQDHNLILKLEFQWHFPSHFGSLISKDILKSFILTKNRKLIFRVNFKRYSNLFKTLMQKSLIYSLK